MSTGVIGKPLVHRGAPSEAVEKTGLNGLNVVGAADLAQDIHSMVVMVSGPFHAYHRDIVCHVDCVHRNQGLAAHGRRGVWFSTSVKGGWNSVSAFVVLELIAQRHREALVSGQTICCGGIASQNWSSEGRLPWPPSLSVRT